MSNIWNKKFDDTTMEKRTFNIETRVEHVDGGKHIVRGHAAVYSSKSQFMGFYEVIAPGAFTDELINKSDVRALINHDPNLIMARSQFGEGTLKLSADDTGLAFEYELPDTSYARDLGINLESGNITQSSFSFATPVDGTEWSTDEDGHDVRTITKFSEIFDTSSVTYPAYKDAESDLVVAQRDLSKYKEGLENEKNEKDLKQRSLVALKIEIVKRK